MGVSDSFIQFLLHINYNFKKFHTSSRIFREKNNIICYTLIIVTHYYFYIYIRILIKHR